MAEHKRTASNNRQQNKRAPQDAEFSDSSLPTELDAMLNELPELLRDDAPDPDVSALSQQEELIDDEPLDLKDPAFAAELADDPVRLYLREIGQVKLLDASSEFHLATMIEANRLIVSLSRHPLRKGLSTECAIYHALIAEMLTSWERLLEDTARLNSIAPNLIYLLDEANALCASSETKEPSYLRNYLDNGMWGMDELWNSIARKAYSVFLSLYLLPPSYADWLLKHLHSRLDLPNQRTLFNHLPSDDILRKEMDAAQARAVDANQALIRANLRLVVSVAKRYLNRGINIQDSDSGGQFGINARGQQIRSAPRIQIQHLRHLVDSTIHQPFHRRASADDSNPRAFVRSHQPRDARAEDSHTTTGAKPHHRRGRHRSRLSPCSRCGRDPPRSFGGTTAGCCLATKAGLCHAKGQSRASFRRGACLD
jgi:hypothetical protein